MPEQYSRKCVKCGKKVPGGALVTIPGKNLILCRDCADGKYEKCDVCDKHISSADLVPAEGRSVCIWCVMKNYIFCPHCGGCFSLANAVKFHGYYLCCSCRDSKFRKCGLCGLAGEKEDFETLTVGGVKCRVCLSCQEKFFAFCRKCGQFCRKEDLKMEKGRMYCPGCLEKEFFVCRFCGKKVRRTENNGGTGFCTACLKLHARCHACGKYSPPGQFALIGEYTYCQSCIPQLLSRLKNEQNYMLEALGASALGAWAGYSLADSLFSSSGGDLRRIHRPLRQMHCLLLPIMNLRVPGMRKVEKCGKKTVFRKNFCLHICLFKKLCYIYLSVF
ncbi:MAG: hypothetical protein IKA79_01420 [Lentisphaeria bacterium]|nr:hypothetical protein [Lentisphaeria bacterium]